jgi:hypothetical protein
MLDMDDYKNLFKGLLLIKKKNLLSGGCNTNKAGPKKIKSSFYHYQLHNPFSRNNNCFFNCLDYILKTDVDVRKMRKDYNIPTGTEVSIHKAYTIIHDLKADIEIIDYETNEELDVDKQYMVFKDNHYYVLISFEKNERKNII